MRATLAIARRELAGYFATPVATVFITIFLVLVGALTFNLGDFFARGRADLVPFFNFLPWVLLLLVPALTMRLWAEERRSGTIELLFTLPVTHAQAVLGKFLAAWAIAALAIALTFPFVLTVNLLGAPDNGVLAAGYLGALLLAGAFLAIGAAASALTRSQIIAFVIGLALCFLFAAAASPIVGDYLHTVSPAIGEALRHAGFLPRYDAFTRGVIALPDLVFFAAVIGFFLFANGLIIALCKADR